MKRRGFARSVLFATMQRMAKVILAGGSGFLGRALGHALAAGGWEVVVLSRNPRDGAAFREVLWNGETGGVWATELTGAAALLNLAGRSINCVHSLENSREIVASRLNSLKALAKGYARVKNPPPVWVQCSATGYYGNAGDRFCEETLAPGPGFLAEVCRQWRKGSRHSTCRRCAGWCCGSGRCSTGTPGPFPPCSG